VRPHIAPGPPQGQPAVIPRAYDFFIEAVVFSAGAAPFVVKGAGFPQFQRDAILSRSDGHGAENLFSSRR
jgi:hypothetical protein